MAKLIDLQVVGLPALRVVGKRLRVPMAGLESSNPIPGFWDKCFEDGTFAALEALKDFVFDDAYVGWMADWAAGDGQFTYVCGMLMKPGCPVPDGFVSRDIEPTVAAVGWIQGTSVADVCSVAHRYTQRALEEAGYTSACFNWCMELYNCPRFTTPDADGNIVLDYYIPCKK